MRSARGRCRVHEPGLITGKRYLDWQLTDPAGKSPAQVRPIRDDIGARVRGLLAELTGR